MTTLADIQSDPKFQALSPDAKGLVFDKLSQSDPKFGALSPAAQEIVRQKLIGNPAAASTSAASAPIASSTPNPTTGQYLLDQAKKGLVSLAALPGLAVDALNIPIELGAEAFGTHASKNPLFGTKYIIPKVDRLLGVQNLPVPKDQYGKPEDLTRYAGAVVRNAAASAIPSVGMLSIAKQPLVAGLTDLVSIINGGIGQEVGGDIAKQVAPGHEELGKVIGGLAGGLVGTTTVNAGANAVVRGAGNIGKFSKTAQKADAAKVAGKEIASSIEADPLAAGRLNESQQLRQQIPGFNPTLGQASGAPGVMALEKNVVESSPENLTKAQSTLQQNTDAVNAYKAAAFPDTQAGPLAPAKASYLAKNKAIEGKIDQVQNQINNLADKYQYQDNAAVGDALRKLRQDNMNAVRNVKNAKYQNVYAEADKLGIKANMSDVRGLVKNIMDEEGNAFQGPNMPMVFSQILKKYGPKKSAIVLPNGQNATQPAEASFQELHSLMRQANREYYAVKDIDPTKAYLLNKVRTALNDKVKGFESPQYGNFAKDLEDANNFYVNQYQKVFREGLGAKIANIGKYGETTNAEDIVRNLIFKPNNEKGINDFFNVYGTDENALKLLQDGIVDVFAKNVVRDGEIKPNLANTFFRKYHQALDKLPSVKSALSDTAKANELLVNRRSVLHQQQKLLDKTTLAKIAGSDDPDAVINKALTDRKTMAALTSQAAKTPQGSNALARSIADNVSARPNPYEFLVENAATIKPAMDKIGKDHFKNLVTIAKAMGVLKRGNIPSTISMSGTVREPFEQMLGTSGKSIFSQLRAAAQGRQSKEYLIADIGGKFLLKTRQEEAQRLLQEAIYDPQVAKLLAETTRTGSLPKGKWGMLRSLIGKDIKLNEGVLGARILMQSENQPEQKNKK